jgi:hypothetical protein
LNRRVAAIDELLPSYDVNEVHSVELPLDPGRTIAAALATPVVADPLVRTLLRMRYWRVVGPFSALIRRRWLARIARGAR